MNQNANEEQRDSATEVSRETADEGAWKAASFETPESSTEEDEGDPPFPIEGGVSFETPESSTEEDEGDPPFPIEGE